MSGKITLSPVTGKYYQFVKLIDGVSTNFKAFEDTVDGEVTFELSSLSDKIIITNDDSTQNLFFKLNAAPNFCTLKPGESINVEFATKTIILSGASVPYRCWVFS